MSASGLRDLVDNRAMIVPLDLDQYHRMIATGILPEGAPIELLDGYLVRKDRSKAGADPMTVGHHRAWAIGQLGEFQSQIAKHGCNLRLQQPVAIPPDSEPEPDAAIVAGTNDRYRHGHPGPADVICIIEVADSSLQHDRTTKLRIYADAAVPQYIIINLVDATIEEYRQPLPGTGRYELTKTLTKTQSISFTLADATPLDIPVARLLP